MPRNKKGWVRTVTHPATDALDLLHEVRHELVIDTLLHNQTRSGYARLTGGDETRKRSTIRRCLSISIVEYYDWCL